MAEGTSPAHMKEGGGSLAGAGGGGATGGCGTSSNSTLNGNGKIAFVTGVTGQVSCEATRTIVLPPLKRRMLRTRRV